MESPRAHRMPYKDAQMDDLKVRKSCGGFKEAHRVCSLELRDGRPKARQTPALLFIERYPHILAVLQGQELGQLSLKSRQSLIESLLRLAVGCRLYHDERRYHRSYNTQKMRHRQGRREKIVKGKKENIDCVTLPAMKIRAMVRTAWDFLANGIYESVRQRLKYSECLCV